MRTKLLLIASAAVILALPAIAQQTAAPQQAPAPAGQAPAPTAPPSSNPVATEGGADETAVEEVSNNSLQAPAPPVEYPGWARRDPWTVGRLEPNAAGLSAEAWGGRKWRFPFNPHAADANSGRIALGAYRAP